MFSQISLNWKGQPLVDYETIGATKNNKNLTISRGLDEKQYQKGVKISDEEMEKINLKKRVFHG